MTIKELLPVLQELPRADKLRLIQFLAVELTKEESDTSLQPDEVYSVWSPYDAFEAADTLLEVLAEKN